ncbi:dihydrodipicolinate synthase family protein [Paenibacillus sp. HJGM_3]|uniref:dihydrodipicolinate synthase family protein n=1 Tax=Paenibacillus sp. HJGM_3 TaxID=3379816 RepID=UPI00385B03B0
METTWIHGVIPPIVTPVDTEELVDEERLRGVVEHVLAGGVHGILSLGSNGEFYGLDEDEQERAVRITLDQTAGRVPVYMGIGAITTKACIRLARLGETLGVQALTILPPMFLTSTEEELYTHFRRIAEATSLPVLLYNNPDRVGNNITANLIERLAHLPNVVGVKDSSGDMTLTAEYIRRTRHTGFRVMAGRDTMIYGSLAYGAVGCVASTANIVPALVVEIYEKFRNGDMQGALEAQFKLAPLRLAFNLASFPVVTKEAMNLLGVPVGASILPNTPATEGNREKLKAILQQMGAL